MSSHEVAPHGHAHGYSSRLVTGRGVGLESQRTQFPVTTTPGDDRVGGNQNQPLTSTGTLIVGKLGQRKGNYVTYTRVSGSRPVLAHPLGSVPLLLQYPLPGLKFQLPSLLLLLLLGGGLDFFPPLLEFKELL